MSGFKLINITTKKPPLQSAAAVTFKPSKIARLIVDDPDDVDHVGPRPETFEFYLLASRCRLSFYSMRCSGSCKLGIPTSWS